MNCLDANAVIDYLHGNDGIGEYLDDYGHLPQFAPTVVLHEVFTGVAQVRGREGVEETRQDLDWLEPLELSADGAAEAALVRAELQEAGTPIGPLDTLIAGIARDCGATLVTADKHFQRVDGLAVQYYR